MFGKCFKKKVQGARQLCSHDHQWPQQSKQPESSPKWGTGQGLWLGLGRTESGKAAGEGRREISRGDGFR